MANVTYYLGAGASANCLPVITDIENRLTRMSDHIEEFKPSQKVDPENEFDSNLESVQESLKIDIKWILEQTEKHKTIDTLAKKFFHQNKLNTDLLRLKRVMIFFFLYEQTFKSIYGRLDYSNSDIQKKKELPDKRYDSFIASIIENKIGEIKLPGTIKIITWNYDLQFELALKEYSQNQIKDIQNEIQAIPSSHSIEKDLQLDSIDFNKFIISRLNGVSTYEYSNATSYWDSTEEKVKDKFNRLLKIYEAMNSGSSWPASNLFNFAWETNPDFKMKTKNHDLAIEVAKKIASQTDIFVFIGYSFPVFNRKIDKLILEHVSPGRLQEIHIQDLNPQRIKDILIGSFSWANRINSTGRIFLDTNKEQFVFPNDIL